MRKCSSEGAIFDHKSKWCKVKLCLLGPWGGAKLGMDESVGTCRVYFREVNGHGGHCIIVLPQLT